MNLPPDSQEFVQQMIATGNFASPDDVVVAALNMMRARQQRVDAFRASLLEADRQIEDGEGGPLDFDELLAEGRRLFAQRHAG